MKQILLASALIAVPVAVFSFAETRLPAAVADRADAQPLGDLSAYETIVVDTQTIAAGGDLGAAEARVTDFETMWDDAEPRTRPMNEAAWGNVDAAADAAFSSLRAGHPDRVEVDAALGALAAALADPAGAGGATGPAREVAGVAVTDANGHPLPCETMLGALRAALSDGSIPAARGAAATALRDQATERCNADDDTRADTFAAQALALAAR